MDENIVFLYEWQHHEEVWLMKKMGIVDALLKEYQRSNSEHHYFVVGFDAAKDDWKRAVTVAGYGTELEWTNAVANAAEQMEGANV